MRASDVTAAELLSTARERAGLTQRELAVKAGVSQSVIAAYEGARREPALSTLVALIEAAGVRMDVVIELDAAVSVAPVGGPIARKVRRNRAALLAIAARHGVTDLRLFGSVARGDETADSDLDLLVRLPEGAGLFLLGRFTQEVQDLIGVSVDVVPDDSVKARLRQRIERDLVPL